MTRTPPVDTVIFDLGGVLSANGRPSDLLRRFPDDPADLVLEVVMGRYGEDSDHPWHRLERGEISMVDYRAALTQLVNQAGLRPAPDTSQPNAFSFDPNPGVIDLVHDLKGAGIKLGVLTNNVKEFRDAWKSMLDFSTLFDDVVDSHEVGLRKPDPAIYRLALSRLGSTAPHTAFLDDVDSNVRAAVALGFHGIVVDHDPSEAIEQVRELTGVSRSPQ